MADQVTYEQILQLVETGAIRSPESAEEKSARITREKAEHDQRLRHENMLFHAFLVLLAVVVLLSTGVIGYEVLSSSEGEDNPGPAFEIAKTLLTAIVSGALGYITGRATSKPVGR